MNIHVLTNQISLQSLQRLVMALATIVLLFLILNVIVSGPEVLLAQAYWFGAFSSADWMLASDDLLLLVKFELAAIDALVLLVLPAIEVLASCFFKSFCV